MGIESGRRMKGIGKGLIKWPSALVGTARCINHLQGWKESREKIINNPLLHAFGDRVRHGAPQEYEHGEG